MLSILSRNDTRSEFTAYKSNVCHLVKDMGDIEFLISALETDEISALWAKGWQFEALYLLAMVDYLSRENNIALCDKYNYLRSAMFKEPVYPTGVLLMSRLGYDNYRENSLADAIPEFLRHNIIEAEVRNVY